MEQVQADRPIVETPSVLIKPKNTWQLPNYFQLRTQKAKGIYFINQIVSSNYGISMYGLKHSVIPVYEFTHAEPEMQMEMIRVMLRNIYVFRSSLKPLFARPCPTVPRHGFVDSRVLSLFDKQTQEKIKFSELYSVLVNFGESEQINLLAEHYENSVKEIIKETYEADSNGEVVFMYYLDSNFNYIVTPGSLTIGRGHDGATVGRKAITLPIVNNFVTRGVDEIGRTSVGILENETPYYEMVRTTQSALCLVQIRSGPEVQGEQDFIPEDLTVETIVDVNPDMNLLEWEIVASNLQGKPGVVVYHEGGSVNSHFGVHCVINKLPYVTSGKPHVGQQLKKIERKQWHDKDYLRLAQHIAFYDSLPNHAKMFAESSSEYASLALAGLHALVSLLSSRNDYSMRAIALSLAFTARLFNTVAVGELRHAKKQTTQSSIVTEMFNDLGMNEHIQYSDSRHDVYCDAMKEKSFIDIAHKYTVPAYYLYAQPGWHDSYGGKAWSQCAHGSLQFTRKLAEFLQEPSEDTFTNLMNEFNTVVHLAHNNGWWLNKVLSSDDFNTLSKEPAAGYINNIAYDLLRYPETEDYYGQEVENLIPIIAEDHLTSFYVYREELKQAALKAVASEQNCIAFITNCGYTLEEE